MTGPLTAAHRAAFLAEGQAVALAVMLVDRCLIRRPNPALDTEDPVTHRVTPGYDTLYPDEPCRTRSRGQWSEQRKVGEANLAILTREIQLRMSVTDLEPGDEIKILSVGDSRDDELVGRVFVVRDLGDQSDTTTRRPLCTLTTG